jgi:lipoyl(octanoyl) transferase
MLKMQIIPYCRADAATNMAFDHRLLTAWSTPNAVRWRSYGWSEPALTFGYAQQWDAVRRSPEARSAVCIRRTTGGGIVDHRHDFTYACVIPASHPLHALPAIRFYQIWHSAIASALTACGVPASLAPCTPCLPATSTATPSSGCGSTSSQSSTRLHPAGPAGATHCFVHPEPADVIDPLSSAKLAGAALRRTRIGLLIQGSIATGTLPLLSIAHLNAACISHVALLLAAEPNSVYLPPLALCAAQARIFADSAWNERRAQNRPASSPHPVIQ